MAYNFSPKIVTDGLVLYLDAANTRSYVSGSTTWNDISRGGNNGTLTNFSSPSPQTIFNPANGGSIVFDGADDYVVLPGISTQTICLWGKLDPTIVSLAGLVCNSVSADTSLRTQGGSFRAVAPNVANIDDFHFGYVSQFMINGVSNLSTDVNGYFVVPNGRTLQQNFYVGAIGNGITARSISHLFNGRLYKGNIYSVLLYNRRLSNNELLQNYNTTKTRFGL